MNADVVPIGNAKRVPSSPPLSARSDDELMLLCRGGQRAAFAELFRRHQDVALRVAYRSTGDVTAAQDVVQDAFVNLYNARERYQAQGKFVGYLCRIITNEARMLHRKRGTAKKGALTLRASDAPGAAPPPDDTILNNERQRDLSRALETLSDKIRPVLALRYGAEFSTQEIADSLEIPVGTVKSRLFHGLAQLKSALGGQA